MDDDEEVQIDTIPESPFPSNTRVTTKPKDVARLVLVSGVLLILGYIVVYGSIAAGGNNWTQAKEYLDIVLPAIIAIVGGVIGFYFGSSQHD